MRGICIDFSPRNVGTIWPEPVESTPTVHAVPPDDTAFCYFFRPIFPHMRELYWFASNFYSTPFSGLMYENGGEDRLDNARLDIGPDSNSALHRPGTLPELAPYINDDWINLIGLRCSDDEEALAIARRLSSEDGDFDRYVDRNAELAFHCMDGFWWEFYPRDSALLELVTRPLEGAPGVSIRSCDLDNRKALFDPTAI